MNNWTWEENSILYNISPYTPPKDIFQAVCNEVGRYYSERGGKYTKSNRKLKWLGKNIRIELGFWSSHSNMAGEYVNFEIVTSLWALNTEGLERKGILNFGARPKNFNVYGIDYDRFFEIIKYIDGVLVNAWLFDSEKGLREYLENVDKEVIEYLKREVNNVIYINSILKNTQQKENA